MMMDETRKNRGVKNEYGRASAMNENEKRISFLNRYFVYKKIRNVDVDKILLDDFHEGEGEEGEKKKEKEKRKYKKREKGLGLEGNKEKEKKERKPRKLKETVKLDD
jgi:hypothetical protein